MIFASSSSFLNKNYNEDTIIIKRQEEEEQGKKFGYVCVNIDWWPSMKCNYNVCPWYNSSIWSIEDLNNKKFIKRVKLLSPFLLRIGGSLQDQYEFTQFECDYNKQFPINPNRTQGFDNGCITMKRIYEISKFCLNVGCQIVWGLNSLYGRKQIYDDNGNKTAYYTSWNSTNAKSILEFMYYINTPLYAITVGNEVWGEIETNLTVSQAIDTYTELNTIITNIWGEKHYNNNRPLIAGFDTVFFTSYQYDFIRQVLYEFIQRGIQFDILNYHDYPLGSSNDDNVVQKAMTHNPGVTNLAYTIHTIAQETYTPKPQVWVSECGGSYNSGSQQATGSYASGFWFLDYLAMTHHAGHKHFCRQTLTGGLYGLLDSQTRKPHPDFWNAVLYQNLLDEPLIQYETSNLVTLTKCCNITNNKTDDDNNNDNNCENNDEDPSKVRWYIYKAKNKTMSHAILGINFSNTSKCGLYLGSNTKQRVKMYILTPGNGKTPSTSYKMNLNGKQIQDWYTLNDIDNDAKIKYNIDTLWLQPYTYGFFELFTTNNDFITTTTNKEE